MVAKLVWCTAIRFIIVVAKQQCLLHPHADKSSEAPQEVRDPLDAQKKRLPKDSRLCHIVTDYRTLIDDLWRIIEFADWLHDEALEISPSPEKVYLVSCNQEEGL